MTSTETNENARPTARECRARHTTLNWAVGISVVALFVVMGVLGDAVRSASKAAETAAERASKAQAAVDTQTAAHDEWKEAVMASLKRIERDIDQLRNER
jgi:hypothetical protein